MIEPELYQGDCLELLPKLADDSVNLVLTDPPYGTTQNKWDSVIPLEPMWKELKRICKKDGVMVFTASQSFAARIITSNFRMFRYDLVWSKNKPTGFLNAKRMPLRSHELVLVFYERLPTYNPQKTSGHKPVNSFTKHTSDGTNYGATSQGIQGGGQTDRYPTSVITIPVINNDSKEKHHPTQKPVALMEYLIKTYTNEGDTVLDFTMGSGTTGVAALGLNRKFIGIEQDFKYWQIACDRMDKVMDEMKVAV